MKKKRRYATKNLGATAIGIAIYIAAWQLFFPYEVIWMEGSILDQVRHMSLGNPLYSAPSLEYVAWPYQPLYYYTTYCLSSILGLSFVSGRLVSVFSTIGTAVMLYYGLK